MKMMKELSIILLFSVVGEGLRLGLKLPVPGSIIGIILLFLAFQLKIIKPTAIEETANFLLNHLTILFVPAGVGLMQYYAAIRYTWPILLGAVVLGSIVSLIFVGHTAQLMEKMLGKKTLSNEYIVAKEKLWQKLRGEADDFSAGE